VHKVYELARPGVDVQLEQITERLSD